MIDDQWRKTLIFSNATIKQAIKNLDASAMQIILVVSHGDILLGTLTDGDIRRGLLRGLDLNSNIDTLICRDSLVVPPQLGRETVLQLMKANKIHQLPVVDDQGRVVGLHFWDELLTPNKRSNIMVIMAGGKGTRLRPYTENCPKPLLLVDGKPMLEHIIERAKAEGLQHFILAIHYLGHMIKAYFGDGSRFGVKIDYIHEESPLGTAGALSFLNQDVQLPFIVSNGDVLTDIHYGELLDFHISHMACATMAVRLHEWQHPFGVVRTKGVDIIGFEEKPIVRNHVNAGIYVLDPSVLDNLVMKEPCDMPTLFARLQEKNQRTIVYPMHEPWLDVGREEDFNRAQVMHLQDHVTEPY